MKVFHLTLMPGEGIIVMPATGKAPGAPSVWTALLPFCPAPHTLGLVLQAHSTTTVPCVPLLMHVSAYISASGVFSVTSTRGICPTSLPH